LGIITRAGPVGIERAEIGIRYNIYGHAITEKMSNKYVAHLNTEAWLCIS